MKKDKFTESKAENNPTGGVLVGKRQGQTIIHNKGTLSGYLVGKTHAEGGIKAINKSTGQPLEMQGGEVVITAPAVSDQSKHNFDGEMLTNRQILSKINEKGGGVAFAQDGMEIPKSVKHTGASYNFGGKTMTDYEIITMMNGGENLNLVSESKKGDHTSRDLNNYNDLLDVGADGQVGMDNGLAFDNGGDVDCYADGGATLSAEVFEWDKVPANYKNTTKVKKVPFINNPLDKGLDSIIAPFLGKDDLRPSMSGINFDENGITGTNAHILITLPYPNKKYEGIYDVNKAKKTKSDELLLINEKYPNYQAVIPKIGYGGKPYQVDVYKLLQYTKTAMNYANKTTYAIAYKYGEDERIGINGKFLSIVLTTALKLGHEKIYVFIESRSRAVVFSPNKNYELGNDELLLTMPVMLEANDVSYIDKYGTNDPDYNRSLKAYFDFNDNEIHNADGSVAQFKMKYENNLSVDDTYLALLSKITNKRNYLPILDYVKVENGKMTATDLEISLIIKDVNMPDGIYEIVNKAPNITMNPIEEFPRERIFDKEEYTSRGNSDTRKNTSFQFVTFSEVFEFYLEKLLLSVGNDDLRPVMSGICIKKTSENQLFLISTNAHTLCKINITEYCEFNKDDRELEYILPVNYLKDFVKLADGSLHFKCSLANIFIEAENLEFIARATDGKYPNYEAVIPKENNKKIVFDHSLISKCLKSEKYTNLLAKYKNDKNINYQIYNSGDKLFIRAYKMEFSKIVINEEIEFCSVDIAFSENNKRITENDSIFLLMPVMVETDVPNRYFAFSKNYFDVMLKTITDTEVECYFTEPNRAYIFPIDAIDYKKTLPVEKTKQQKLSKADLKMIEEMETIQSESNELQDAIETLELLLETAKGKDKREIKEALEVLQMLNEK
jgi:DNA polymerase III sliding clamp (beta) subunit (PCNA family)